VELSHRLVCTFVNLHLQMLISATKLLLFTAKSCFSYILLVRKTQEEGERREEEREEGFKASSQNQREHESRFA